MSLNVAPVYFKFLNNAYITWPLEFSSNFTQFCYCFSRYNWPFYTRYLITKIVSIDRYERICWQLNKMTMASFPIAHIIVHKDNKVFEIGL